MISRLDDDLPKLLGFLSDELLGTRPIKAEADNTPTVLLSPNPSYKSMLLATVAMSFVYNSGLALKILEEKGHLDEILKTLLNHLDSFKDGFES